MCFVFQTQQLGHFNKAPGFESLSSEAKIKMKEKPKERKESSVK